MMCKSSWQRSMRNCCGRSLRNRFGTQLRIANSQNPRKISVGMLNRFQIRASKRSIPFRRFCARMLLVFFLFVMSLPALAPAWAQDREDEIIANLAGGRVIVHVARDVIIFAAIDQPVEPNSIPPRV